MRVRGGWSRGENRVGFHAQQPPVIIICYIANYTSVYHGYELYNK